MGGHTPGPWRIVERASINGARIAALDGTIIGGVSAAADKPLDQKAADARLFAAAPELLEALQFADETFAGLSWDADGTTRKPIRAAIAKATILPQTEKGS